MLSSVSVKLSLTREDGKPFLKYTRWGVGLAIWGLIIATVGIIPVIDEQYDTSEKAPSYSFAVVFFGLAIMSFGPFVILPIIRVVGRYRRDLESRIIWGVIGLAIGINAAIALVAAFVFIGVDAVFVFLRSLSLTFLVIVPAILKAQWSKSGRV